MFEFDLATANTNEIIEIESISFQFLHIISNDSELITTANESSIIISDKLEHSLRVLTEHFTVGSCQP
ncbi:hypothetical protein NBRC116591_40560 [Sessilibacter corallicola]|uniref:Uncharacterized protein n=1 Tax=Sessilibacter corallicola TaxID=2904075 RepID=A0ABQ0AF16_9GAMM